MITVTATDASGGTASVQLDVAVAVPTAFGASVDAVSDLGRWQAQTGRPLPVVRVYFPGNPPATWQADTRLAALPLACIVVLSFKSGTVAAVQAFLASRPAGQQVYACYWHEPEDDIEKGSFTAAAFRTAQASYAPAIRAAGVIPTVILMDYTLNPASHRNWRDYLQPGAVDVIGWDSYNPARKSNPPAYTDYPTKIIPPIEAVAAETGLPWGLGEFGSPIVGTDPQRVAWVTTTRQALADRALWVCWYDVIRAGFDNSASAAVMQAWE